MTLSWHHIGKANLVNDEKGYLKNQAPLCIIYLERWSEVKIPICPQLNVRKEIAFTLVGGMLFLFVIIVTMSVDV